MLSSASIPNGVRLLVIDIQRNQTIDTMKMKKQTQKISYI